MTRISVGDIVEVRSLCTIAGEVVDVAASDEFVQLLLCRFARCPFCNLHGVHAYDQWSVDELLGLAAERAST